MVVSRHNQTGEGSRRFAVVADHGSVSVVVVGMLAVTVVMMGVSMTAGVAVAQFHQLGYGADLGALVAADTAFGHHGGEPCANARRVVESNQSQLTSCKVDESTVVVARREILGIPFTRSARAG